MNAIKDSNNISTITKINIRGIGYAKRSGKLVMRVFFMCRRPTPCAPGKHNITTTALLHASFLNILLYNLRHQILLCHYVLCNGLFHL